MAKVADIQASLDAVKADLTTIAAFVAAGQPATQAQVDALALAAADLKVQSDAVVAAIPPAAPAA